MAGVLRAWEMKPGAPRNVAALLGMAQDGFQAVLMDAGPANVEEMDDLHRQAILHPGPVVIPALASLARNQPLETGRVLDAVVRGYEAMIRIGRAVGRRHYFYWHNTATAGRSARRLPVPTFSRCRSSSRSGRWATRVLRQQGFGKCGWSR